MIGEPLCTFLIFYFVIPYAVLPRAVRPGLILHRRHFYFFIFCVCVLTQLTQTDIPNCIYIRVVPDFVFFSNERILSLRID